MNEIERKARNDAFAVAATPMVAFLRKYGDPHMTAVITDTNASLYSGELGLPYPYPEKDPSPEFFDPKPVGSVNLDPPAQHWPCDSCPFDPEDCGGCERLRRYDAAREEGGHEGD